MLFGGGEESVNDEGDGAVAGYVAGGAEAVHGYVEGDHEGLVCLGETEHACQDAQGGHDCATGHSGSRDYRDAYHTDKPGKHTHIVWHSFHYHQRDSARHNLHGTSGHMDSSTKGYDEPDHVFSDSHLDCLTESDGDSGSRRLSAEGREVSGEHCPQQFERISPHKESGYAILEYKQEDVHGENHKDYLREGCEHGCHLSGDGHVKEDAEDI